MWIREVEFQAGLECLSAYRKLHRFLPTREMYRRLEVEQNQRLLIG